MATTDGKVPGSPVRDVLTDGRFFLTPIWRDWLQKLLDRVNSGVYVLTVQTTNHTPTAGAPLFYVKGAKLVLAYDSAGTTRYKTLDLDAVDITWADSGAPP